MAARDHPPGSVLMRPTLDALARNWWLVLLRGLAAIVFGVLTLLWPGITLLVLVLLYGVFALFDGIFSIASAIRGGALTSRWWLAVVGVLGLIVGALTLTWPGITGFVLLYFIAGWAIAAGVLQIVGGVKLRREIDDEWLLILSGLLSVVFGLLIIAFPGPGALGLAVAIGAFAIMYGVLLASLSLRLKRYAEVRI